MLRIGSVVLLLAILSANLVAQEMEKPSKHHERMKVEVGKWTFSMKMLVGPEMPPMPGTEVNEMMPGGLWMVSKFDADSFQGHGVFGYDARKKKHVGIWVDNSTSHMTRFEGDVDDKGVMTMHGESLNAMTGKMEKIKTVTRMIGEDAKKFAMYSQGADGKWTKTFEIDYKRAKK